MKKIDFTSFHSLREDILSGPCVRILIPRFYTEVADGDNKKNTVCKKSYHDSKHIFRVLAWNESSYIRH